jgi:hypothetical protein
MESKYLALSGISRLLIAVLKLCFDAGKPVVQVRDGHSEILASLQGTRHRAGDPATDEPHEQRKAAEEKNETK